MGGAPDRPPFPMPPCGNPYPRPGHLVFKASRLFVRLNERRLSRLGLSAGQIPVALGLRRFGSLTQKDLAAMAEVEQPTMAAMLSRMERDGLIERATDPSDRRSRRVALTEAGERACAEVGQILEAVNEKAYAGFSQEERGLFATMLRRMIANLEEEAATLKG